MIFTKFFPIISIWEVREGREKGIKETEERIKSYLPGKGAWSRIDEEGKRNGDTR
jgi:hypothetical protein